MARLFLYLNQLDYVKTWTHGGQAPINLASSYRTEERAGIYTPDENLQYDSPIPFEEYAKYGIVLEGEFRRLTVAGNIYNGKLTPSIFNASRYSDDGLILSFSTRLSQDIATRMNKVACVEITGFDALRRMLDKQVGGPSQSKRCRYTTDHQRNHFLKSVEDAWQCEHRLFWPGNKTIWVTIPPGIAKPIDLAKSPR